MSSSPLLRLEGVSKHFGGLAALDNISFDVPHGQILGLIGPNGAGKTTLINLITGFSQASAGMITFDGTDISALPPHQIHTSGIARTFQNIRLFTDMTVEENLLVGRHDRTRSGLAGTVFQLPSHRREEQALRTAAAELLAQMGMLAYRYVPAGELAYGDQRRVEIMRALAGEPKLLLLDEPSAGMNEKETEQLGRFILSLRERDITMIVIEHDMNLITQVCDWVQVLNFGRLIGSGTPEHIKSDPAVIVAYLGEED